MAQREIYPRECSNVHLRRKCILLTLDGIFYKYKINPSSQLCHLRSIFVPLLIFCLDDLSIDVSGVLKFPTIIVLLSISSLMAVSIWLMY